MRENKHKYILMMGLDTHRKYWDGLHWQDSEDAAKRMTHQEAKSALSSMHDKDIYIVRLD